MVLEKQKQQKKGTSKNQLNPVGAAVSEARPAEAGIYIMLSVRIFSILKKSVTLHTTWQR